MRDVLAHQFDVVATQLLGGVAQPLVRPLDLGDVAGDRHQALLTVQFDGLGGDQAVAHAAVLYGHVHRKVAGTAVPHDGGHQCLALSNVLPQPHGEGRHTDHLVAAAFPWGKPDGN